MTNSTVKEVCTKIQTRGNAIDTLQLLEIEREIKDVLIQNSRLTDLEEWEKAVELFTPDVVFKGIASGVTAEGREANVKSMASRIKDTWRRRVLSNITVTVQDADHATATAYWLMFKIKNQMSRRGRCKTRRPNISARPWTSSCARTKPGKSHGGNSTKSSESAVGVLGIFKP